MRKFIRVIAGGLLCCMLLTSCAGGSGFKSLVENGDYAKAAETYIDNMAGNVDRENEAVEALTEVSEKAISDYLADAIEYEEAESRLETVRLVVEEAGIDFPVAEYETRLVEAYESKIAYDSGMALIGDKNFISAIEQLNKVVEGDPNYESAQEEISSAAALVKEQSVAKAKRFADGGDYDGALTAIREALAVCPDDTELISLETTYSENYITKVIKDADEALVNPGTDYVKSIEILAPAMQKYPENTKLTEKYDYYMGFEPVSLFDFTPYMSENDDLNIPKTVTDNMGNVYEKALHGSPFIYVSGPHDGTYDIGKKYNVLSGIVAIDKQADKSAGSLRIYGDGRLLKEVKTKQGHKPLEINVDITGVTDLKIEFPRNGIFGGNTTADNRVIFADVTLQKTAK